MDYKKRYSLEKIKDSDVVIVTHFRTTGPMDDLEGYLKDKVKTLMFIGHPFYYTKEIRSFYRLHNYGKLIKENKAKTWKLPEFCMYLKDVIYTLFWIIKSKKRFNLFFGADPLNAFTGILFKKIKRINIVVFYTIDYIPHRFKNRILNMLYHRLDTYCVRHSDQIWNLSRRMAEERVRKGIFDDGKQIVVPIGIHYSRIKRLPIEQINRKQVVYLGHLRKGQGLELILNALPKVIEKTPNVKLVIIGSGPLEKKLKTLSNELMIEENIEFKGFIEDHQNVEEILTRCAIGLAPYETNPDSYTQYTDPSKPKQYLACGLPLIITRVPQIAEKIEKNCMGIVINYSEDELSEAVIKLLTDDKTYETYRKNAIKFASSLDLNSIFNHAFSKLIPN